MEAKDVRNLPWVQVDWCDLPATNYSFFEYYVCWRDVDSFVTNVFKNVARELNIPFKELEPILKEENSAFFSLMDRLFLFNEDFYPTDSRLLNLEDLLMVPDTTANNLTTCLRLFEKLSEQEKLAFLQKIGKIKLTVE